MAQILFTLPEIGNKNCNRDCLTLLLNEKQRQLSQFSPNIPSPPKEEKRPSFPDLIPSYPKLYVTCADVLWFEIVGLW